MEKISIKTAYNNLGAVYAAEKPYPADGAVFFVNHIKQLLIGHSIDKILNTWIADYHIPVNQEQTLQKHMVNDMEWEGPFVFIINGQNLLVDFSSPHHYEIGINSCNITDIVNISSFAMAELQKYGHNGQFVDISFLYGDKIIGQTIRDIHTLTNRCQPECLYAILIELQNNTCLVISEEIDNPMLRIYTDMKEAIKAIYK